MGDGLMESLGAEEKRGLCGTLWAPHDRPINLPQSSVSGALAVSAASRVRSANRKGQN